MRKQPYTLIEMLTVIAIIMVLAGLVYPAISSSRTSARAAACVSNQKQTVTAILMSMNANNHHFYSPTYTGDNYKDENDNPASGDYIRWTARLKNRKYLQDYSVMRCSEVLPPPYAKTADNEESKGDQYTFGAVHADLGSSGLNDPKGFDFRGSKLLRYKKNSDFKDIGPAQLMLGACSFNPDTKTGGALLDIGTSDTAPSFPKAKIYLGHRKAANMFFLDGHVATVKGHMNSSKKHRFLADATLPYYLPNGIKKSDLYSVQFDEDTAVTSGIK